MDILIFDLRASLAHFRRPDTTSTHATYPFITRTALRGLLGAVIGLEQWPEDGWAGIQLRNPVATRVQQLSLLGKGFLESGKTFNRPTTVELIVQPYYRIFYSGARLDELAQRIRQRQAVYHTYLGSAFATVVPEFVDIVQSKPIETHSGQDVAINTVVPTDAVTAIAPQPGLIFNRVGGLLYQALPNRRFSGTINLLYEQNNQPYHATLSGSASLHPVIFVAIPNIPGYVALW